MDEQNYYLENYSLAKLTIQSKESKDRAQACKKNTFFSDGDCNFDKESLQTFLQEFQNSDITFITKNESKIENIILFCLQHWDQIRVLFEQEVIKLISLFEAKLKNNPYRWVLHKRIVNLRTLMKNKIDKGKISDNLQVQPQVTNQIYVHYVNHLQRKEKKKGKYMIYDDCKDRNITLHELVSGCKEFYTNPLWKDMFFRAELQDIRNREEQQREGNCPLYRTIPTKCFDLLNASFFYHNEDIFDMRVNDCQIALAGSLESITTDGGRQLFLKELIGLLNNKGGIILWDCESEYLRVLPKGVMLTQEDKLKVVSQIASLASTIVPKIALGVQLTIDFVPLAQLPKLQHKSQLVFRKGFYVPTIKVFKRQTLQVYQGTQLQPYIKLDSVFPAQLFCQQDEDIAKKKQDFLNKMKPNQRQKKNISNNGEAVAPLFQPLLNDDLHFQTYSEHVESLQLAYRLLSADKKIIASLYPASQGYSSVSTFNYSYPQEYLGIRTKYYNLHVFAAQNLRVLLLSQDAAVEKRIFSPLSSILSYFNDLLIQRLKQLQLIRGHYCQDMRYQAQPNTSNRQQTIDKHYADILAFYIQEVSIFKRYRTLICNVWNRDFLFSQEDIKIVLPLSGSPLHSKKQLMKESNSNPEFVFAYASLLITNKTNIPVIIQRLMVSYNIYCVIKPLPQKPKIKGVQNASILYSNDCPHAELKNTFCDNNKFKFNGKAAVVVPISDYLKLATRSRIHKIKNEELQIYSNLLNTNYKGQKLKVWAFETQRTEIQHYLSTDSRASTAYIFLASRHYGWKTQLDNPPDITDKTQIHKNLKLVQSQIPLQGI